MSKESLVTIIDKFEPIDLLHLSKDAFYDVVLQEFPNIVISNMHLSFIVIESGEVAIRAEIIDYREEV